MQNKTTQTQTTETEPEDVQQIYRLAPIQEGLLFHCLQAADSSAYVEQLSVDLEGSIDLDRLEAACKKSTDQYAVLRTAFVWRDLREPLQLVGRSADLPLVRLDWSEQDADDLERTFASYMNQDRENGFDLAEAPLARVALIKTKDGVRLLWTNHHLILDGWSRAVLFSGIFQEYTGTASLASAQSPPYQAFVDRTLNQDLKQAQEYWSEYLQGFSEPTALPGVAHSVAGEPSGRYDLRVPEGTARAIRDFARANSLTLSTVVQGAWGLLLAHHAGEDDVVFGSTFAGRPPDLTDFEQMVGLLINTLPVRVRLKSATSLIEFFQDLQRQFVRLREFELTPLSRVLEYSEIPPGRALFETVFAFESLPEPDLPEGLRVKPSGFFSDSRSHFPLSLAFLPAPEPLIQWIYDTSLYTEEAIAELGARFVRILDAVSADGQQRPGQLSLLSLAERERELTVFNPPPSGLPRQPLHRIFETVAADFADRVACEFHDGRLTYRELNRQANRLARVFDARGVVPGQVIAILLPPSADFVVAMLAVLKSGAAFVPLDSEQPAERSRFMLEDSGAALLLTRAKHRGQVEHESSLLLEELHELNATDAGDDANPTRPATADDLLYIMYTSGSTGRPKGIEVAHRSVERLVRNTNYIQISSEDVVAQAASVAFDAATFEIWAALLNGARLCGIQRETILDPVALQKTLQTCEVSILFVTTALFNRVARDLPDAFSSLRVLLFGGEASDPDAAARILSARPPAELLHVYGPTESTTFALFQKIESTITLAAPTLPLGLPVTDTVACILDQRLHPVLTGAVGEICLAGEGLAIGYHARPGLTAETFVTAPEEIREAGGLDGRLYRTGDLGRRLADGSIEFVGRRDLQLKLRGYRIEPGEIESRLREHPAVREGVVLVQKTAGDAESLIAYVLAEAGNSVPEVSALRSFLAERIPLYMIPARFVPIDSLPLTPSGKIDRKRIARDAAAISANPAYASGSTKELSDLEYVLCEIWAEVLEKESVGVNDGFYELGGNSLIAVRLLSRMNEALAVDFSLGILLEALSINRFIQAIKQVPDGDRLEETAKVYRQISGLSEEEVAGLLEQEHRA